MIGKVKEMIRLLDSDARKDLEAWLHKINTQNMTVEYRDALNIIERAEQAMKTVFGDIAWSSRLRPHLEARMVLARWLRDQGLSLAQIGRVIHKDHSTVCVLLTDAQWQLAHPDMYPELDKLYKDFINEITREG